jgi:UDP-glucose 4-epimerase
LITGAAGRIGRQTVQQVIAAGHEVVATDNEFRPGLSFKLRLADLCETHAAYELMDGVDAVIHLGNIPHAHAASPAQRVMIDNMAINTNVFVAALQMDIRRLVFVSSIQAITGQNIRLEPHTGHPAPCFPYFPVDGHEPRNPGLNLYAQSKSFAEQSLQIMAATRDQLVATVVRFPYVASSNEFAWRMIKQSHRISDLRNRDTLM